MRRAYSEHMVPFEELREFFLDECEYGQLCDIVAPDAKRDAWRVFLDVIVRRYPYTYSLLTHDSDTVQPLPGDVSEVLDLINSESGPWPGLSLDLGGLPVRVLMSDPDALELDVWRCKITEDRYYSLATLMKQMGDAMGQDIFMTPESSPRDAHLVYAVTARGFRRPLHGDGTLWREFYACARSALSPLAGFTPERGVRAFAEDPAGTLALLTAALRSLCEVDASASELRKQDELTMEQRADFHDASIMLCMLMGHDDNERPRAASELRWNETLRALRPFTP